MTAVARAYHEKQVQLSYLGYKKAAQVRSLEGELGNHVSTKVLTMGILLSGND